MFQDFNTGEIYTLEELKQLFEQFKNEMNYSSFDDYLEKMLSLGYEKIGGLIEL